MKILSAAQIREWDAYTIEQESISSFALMERAAGSCAAWILDSNLRSSNFLVFCGPGNNGGDGLVIAKKLHEAGCQVEAWITTANDRSADCQTALDKAHAAHIQVFSADVILPEISKHTVIIDALLGTGLRNMPTGRLSSIIAFINEQALPVISIDIPSGLQADNSSPGHHVVKASHTLSFGGYKRSFLFTENQPFLGKLHLLDIGLNPHFPERVSSNLHTIELEDAAALYRVRPGHFHKYQFGHALLLAGSRGMMGAAVLAASACLRSGVGLVTVHSPTERMAVLQTAVPESIATDEQQFDLLGYKKNAIGIGPGWEPTAENVRLLELALSTYEGNLILDATALHLLTPFLPLLKKRKEGCTILTPHAGEFDRLVGTSENDEQRHEKLIKLAIEFGCCVVLKGKYTACALPDGQLFFNTRGNSGMATAGSGDVLTGLLTGLCAQGYPASVACRLGVYLHGLAGDIAAANLSEESMIAGDITRYFGAAFRAIKDSRSQN